LTASIWSWKPPKVRRWKCACAS